MVLEGGIRGGWGNGINLAAAAYELIGGTGMGGPSGRLVRIAGCGGGYMAMRPEADGPV